VKTPSVIDQAPTIDTGPPEAVRVKPVGVGILVSPEKEGKGLSADEEDGDDEEMSGCLFHRSLSPLHHLYHLHLRMSSPFAAQLTVMSTHFAKATS
jgi:hypothetical protein